ncbi:MAG: hypothetical protein DLM57_02850 [Pseudonocardiales bacterium]|nr:MAG: hypothetical protein DLM57_02850 [Pseudonocardiales bacterium]
MYSMHEALARERMRAQHQEAQHQRVVSELAAASRWHRLDLRGHAAGRRGRAAKQRDALRDL